MPDAPLYLIPGTMCDARLWAPVAVHLPEAEIRHCDYAGSETMEAMLDALLDQAPAGPCHLVGFSLGGYLAMLIAIKHPTRFKSLVVIATSPYGLSDGEKALRQRNAEMLTRLTYRGMSKTRLKQFVHTDNLEDKTITGTILQMERDMGQQELIRQLLAPINRPDMTEELRALAIPVHFIMAEDDAMVPFEAVEKFTTRSANITLHKVTGSGHMMPFEVPAELAKIIANICE
ncbi:alpha/beta fold hydrolase [Kordiimonas aestuarii]|uniref:alpha/beta fold hydrolase n=1 Tax=Kordiimonas aestuarii TaxID=1005925 RepID=UPI0021D19A03|nr:alpha/beta hydrolase [Kordiimonas aestuarii]